MEDLNKIYREHEKIGFPTIEKVKQVEMLLNRNVSIINELTPGFIADHIPYELYKRYVTLTEEEFKVYFSIDNYIQEKKDIHLKFPQLDSFWFEENINGSFTQIIQERGGIVYKIHYKTKKKFTDKINRSLLGSLDINNNSDPNNMI